MTRSEFKISVRTSENIWGGRGALRLFFPGTLLRRGPKYTLISFENCNN
jgi:hypothetical protein